MLRIRLDLAYDGAGFAGWAKQPGLRTIQGTVEDGLARILRVPVPVTVAGRTDAGVHALRQVLHFDIPPERWNAVPGRSDRSPGVALVHRLNRVLPDEIGVLSADEAPAGFDARFSALDRRYSYTVADGGSPVDPLVRGRMLRLPGRVDVAAMDAASGALVGLRDFAAFCKPRPGASTIRELQEFGWRRVDDGYVVGTVRSDAFCHNMVRALVGAVLLVGEGRRHVDWPLEVLRAGVRSPHVKVVAARGLVLEQVTYPEADALAERAQRIRARRMDEELADG